jgi:hypothetical protein
MANEMGLKESLCDELLMEQKIALSMRYGDSPDIMPMRASMQSSNQSRALNLSSNPNLGMEKRSKEIVKRANHLHEHMYSFIKGIPIRFSFSKKHPDYFDRILLIDENTTTV